ncbi:MAG: helix-hairpin-helix domain-containing protein [Chitinophagaceae bacterium]
MFDFTHKEKIATLILIGILLIVFLTFKKNSSHKENTWKKDILFNTEKYPITTLPRKSLFYFDPNTISEDSFYTLDISSKAIRSILNYRNKGGRFYNKEKIKAMWNLSLDEYKKIEPYIQIHISSKNKIPSKEYATIEINQADSTSWNQLPIPKFLILKIIEYKDRLGGFYDIQQLKEVRYLTNNIFNRIKKYVQCDSAHIIKKNINTISLHNLAQHPYIEYKTAQAITNYRYKKVSIKNWDELKKLGLDSSYLQTLRIYFSLY